MRAFASHQCGPDSNLGVDALCGLSLLLVLSFARRDFSPVTPVFPSPQKPTLPNSNSIWNARSVPWVNKLHYVTTQPTISHQISYELSLRINFKARTYTIQCNVFLVPVSSARKFSWLFAFSFSGSSRWYGRWGCPWTKWLHGKSLFGIPDDNVLHWLGR